MQVRNLGRTQVLVAGIYLGPLASIRIADADYEAWLEKHGDHAKMVARQFLEVGPDPEADAPPAKPAPDPDDLVAAIPRLKTRDFTAKGPPRTEALAKIVGREVSASERDAAWEAHQRG